MNVVDNDDIESIVSIAITQTNMNDLILGDVTFGWRHKGILIKCLD